MRTELKPLSGIRDPKSLSDLADLTSLLNLGSLMGGKRPMRSEGAQA